MVLAIKICAKFLLEIFVFEKCVVSDTMKNLNLHENDFWNYGKLAKRHISQILESFPGNL